MKVTIYTRTYLDIVDNLPSPMALNKGSVPLSSWNKWIMHGILDPGELIRNIPSLIETGTHQLFEQAGRLIGQPSRF